MQFYDPAVTESPIVNTIDAGSYPLYSTYSG
jgi:hypothetical protein